MSLDKSIASGKEHRAPYRGGKAIDTSCRNHGSCPHCQRSRTIAARRAEPVTLPSRDAWRSPTGW